MLKLTKINVANQIVPNVYYTLDRQIQIKKTDTGYDINKINNHGWFKVYLTSTSTLKEARDYLEKIG